MNTCPYCKTALDYEGKYNFCINCEKQIKCINCGEALLPGKTICLICGSHIVSYQAPTNQLNRYSLEEDRTETTASRKIEFTFSDNAIEKATPLFGAKLPLPRITSQVPISIVEDRIALPSPGQFDELLDETKEKTLPTQVIKPAGEDTGLSTLFDKDSQGTLIAQVKDFKGSSRKQQQERFILLYTGAYLQIIGKPVPSRKHFIDAAKTNHIHDQNFHIYWNQVSKKYLSNSDETYKLNHDGTEQVEQILADMENNEVGQGFAYWDSSKSRRKRASISKEDLQLIESSLKKPSACDSLKTREFTEKYHWPILAIYDLTRLCLLFHLSQINVAAKHKKAKYRLAYFS